VDFSALEAGSYVMGITPFDEKGRLDEDTLREHVRWLSSAGINVLPASASSGEGTLLTDGEVFRIWEIVADEASGRFPVIAANREFPTAEENIRFAREAEARGLDGIQLYPVTLGHILKPTAEMLNEFYDSVLPQVNLPVLISSNESTGFEVPLAVHERLIGKHPNVFGFYKNNFDFLNSATFYAEMAPQITVLTGFIRLPMAFLLGATGELDYIQNIAPRTCRTMHDALHSGDLAAAGEAYAHLVRIQSRTSRFWQQEHTMRIPVYKGILRALGRPGSYHARPPFQSLSRGQEKRLAALVDELGIRELEGLD
jgi:dihydrodipicolinate synthase/N-acetylneuraminate lyase